MRFMTYCYDAFGLGHIRRSFVISRSIADSVPGSMVLSIVGSSVAHSFFHTDSSNHDFIKLPTMKKIGHDLYASHYLPIEYGEIIRLRAGLIENAVKSFRPDVLIVDKNPRGLGDEMVEAIERLRMLNPGVWIALSLRDILDNPEAVKPDWSEPGFVRWMQRMYDAIWIWGEPEVYDSVEAYDFPEVLRFMTRYLGYLPPDQRHSDFQTLRLKAGISSSRQDFLIVSAGGGGDALPVFLKVVEGIKDAGRNEIVSLLVAGPLMSDDDYRQLRKAAKGLGPSVRVVRFLENFGDWLRAADAVICMGGYNTMSEVAALGKPALVIPRVYPRLEQYIRAQRFARHGWCQAVAPDADWRLAVRNFCGDLADGKLEHSEVTLACRGLKSLHQEIENVRNSKTLQCAGGY